MILERLPARVMVPGTGNLLRINEIVELSLSTELPFTVVKRC